MENKQQESNNRLGFHEIVPGPHSREDGEHETDIPAFDLSQQMMAHHRRISSAKRRGPGDKTDAQEARLSEKEDTPKPHISGRFTTGPLYADPDTQCIIADIVRRDINRLCGGKAR